MSADMQFRLRNKGASSSILEASRSPAAVEEEVEDQQSFSIPSPQRLVVTHDGQLDRSLLRRKEGFMYKKGGIVNARGGFHNWKKRWFILTSVPFLSGEAFELQYFDSPGGALKGKIGLGDIQLHAESKSTHRNVKFEFQIILQTGAALQLSCEEEKEREEWMETLSMVTTFMRKIAKAEAMTLDGYDPLSDDQAENFELGDQLARGCLCFGPGLFGAEAGQSAAFRLEIHDLLGQKATRGGMPVTAVISNEHCLYHLMVVDNGDGSYFAHYTIGRAGRYQIRVALNDEHDVQGSPFDIVVLPSKTVASRCVASGDALQKLVIDQPARFTIVAQDAMGNRKVQGGDLFEVGVMGSAQLLDLQDNHDGSYTCSVVAQSTAMTHALSPSIAIIITLHGKPIAGSPFKPSILAPHPLTTPKSADLLPSPSPVIPLWETPKPHSSTSLPTTASNRLEASIVAAAEMPPSISSSSPKEEVAMSRLERSRQRALLAKNLVDEKSQLARSAGGGTGKLSTTKLHALAQRSASVLENLRSQQSEALVEDKRDFAVEQVRQSLRSGLLIPGTLASDLSTAQVSTDIIELAQQLLLSKEASERLSRCAATFQSLFELFADRIEGIRAMKFITSQSPGGLVRLLESFDVVPSFCSKMEARSVFNIALRVQSRSESPAAQVGGGVAVDFDFFIKFLLLLVAAVVKKNSAAAACTDDKARIDLLLTRWRLGDEQQLQMVKNKLR